MFLLEKHQRNCIKFFPIYVDQSVVKGEKKYMIHQTLMGEKKES